MGTHGLYGFLFRGKFYVVYNQFDSYARGLGAALLRELLAAIEQDRLGKWLAALEEIREVSSHEESGRWLEEMSESIGSFERFLQSGRLVNVMLDRHGDPEWHEYNYIVNFDETLFHFYVGSNRAMAHKLEAEPLTHLLRAFETSC